MWGMYAMGGRSSSPAPAPAPAPAAAAGPFTVFDTSRYDDHDFLTEGGTSGAGGVGEHTLSDGTVVEVVDWTGTGPARLDIAGGVLRYTADGTNGARIKLDLGATATDRGVVFLGAVFTTDADVVDGFEYKLTLSPDPSAGANYTGDQQLGNSSTAAVRGRFANGASSFNNVLDAGGFDLTAGQSVRARMTSLGASCVWEFDQSSTDVPAWSDALLASVGADSRASVYEQLRYLEISALRGGGEWQIRVQSQREP